MVFFPAYTAKIKIAVEIVFIYSEENKQDI